MHQNGCSKCRSGKPLDFEFTFAFQPIVNVRARQVFAYEALVRGVDGSGAASIMDRLDDDNRYQFDQACRVKAIQTAARLFRDDGALLSINIMPNAVYDPVRCLQSTMRAAKDFNFDPRRLMFEFTEHEKVSDTAHLRRIGRHYESFGCITAIDDFGSGFAGLSFLAEFVPNIIKIDRSLVSGIENDRIRQTIVGAIRFAANKLDIRLIAEGIETADEFEYLVGAGIDLFQGYYFARPGFECLPEVDYGAAMSVLSRRAEGALPG